MKQVIEAIIKKRMIYLSIMKKKQFNEIYNLIANGENIKRDDYDAVTFEIQVENVEEIERTLKIIDVIAPVIMG